MYLYAVLLQPNLYLPAYKWVQVQVHTVVVRIPVRYKCDTVAILASSVRATVKVQYKYILFKYILYVGLQSVECSNNHLILNMRNPHVCTKDATGRSTSKLSAWEEATRMPNTCPRWPTISTLSCITTNTGSAYIPLASFSMAPMMFLSSGLRQWLQYLYVVWWCLCLAFLHDFSSSRKNKELTRQWATGNFSVLQQNHPGTRYMYSTRCSYWYSIWHGTG